MLALWPILKKIRSHVEGFPDGIDQLVGRRWIINAIDCGSLSSVRWMLDQSVELNFRDEEGCTVLHACLERESGEAVDILCAVVAAGADVNIRGSGDLTPLHKAGARGNLAAVRILIDAGADRSIRTKIDGRITAAEYAVICGQPEAASLIETYRAK